jgi:hypothetical protein
MNKATFESKLLPDGHLYCPNEFGKKKNAQFMVIVTFEDSELEASEHDTELSAVIDNSTEFLSEEELSYYFSLKEL